MNKLVLVIPAALILAGCNAAAPGQTTTSQQQQAEKLAQIIDKGGSADCTVTNLADKSTTQIVVSGKKMKIVGSDFGQGKKGTMINDTVNSYIWSEGDKTGIKMKIVTVTPTGAAAAQPTTADAESTAKGYEDETKYKMDCVGRSIKDSEFVPPTDVTFTDFSVPPSIPGQGK